MEHLPGYRSRTFITPGRWELHATGTEGQMCELIVENPPTPSGPDYRYVKGFEILVHGRTAGLHNSKDPKHCSISVHGDDKDLQTLPLTVERTGQSSASPLFHSDGPFRVTITRTNSDPGPDTCNASVFDDRTGAPAEGRATTTAPLLVETAGDYYVITEMYDCRLTIEPAI